ncbi:MAG: hypothetical protein KKI08_09210 [Armatimonadetes bacterium]|nr:hypothetical protein [Armatimonadota bacterium]
MTNAVAMTNGSRHHFFGFHDLVEWNAAGDKLLALQVEDITHPPYPGDRATVGFVRTDTRDFVPLGTTTAFNYPQGARQQWLGGHDRFVVNDRVEDMWGARIYDTASGDLVGELAHPAHCHSARTGDAFGLNYARLHRLGGYGYVGLPDPWADDPAPERDGITRHSIETGEAELIVSLRAVACHDATTTPTGAHHYVTHLRLNPPETRLAFLHRYDLPDGGEMTRLMTVGVGGEDLRCLARGFLSHFDWLDDEHVMIWGRRDERVAALRGHPALAHPLLGGPLRLAKRMARRLLGRSAAASMSFLVATDRPGVPTQPMAVGVLTEDGHPMSCPANRDWCVTDTYPSPVGVRTLMLYQVSANRRVDLGQYPMLAAEPDTTELGRAYDSLAPAVRRRFPPALYAFTRSGLHCDLHPRWNADGTRVAFDSIHEGTRQIYALDVTSAMGGER